MLHSFAAKLLKIEVVGVRVVRVFSVKRLSRGQALDRDARLRICMLYHLVLLHVPVDVFRNFSVIGAEPQSRALMLVQKLHHHVVAA